MKSTTVTNRNFYVLDDVIIPYVELEREKLELPTQAALIMMGVFKGQITTLVLQKIRGGE